MSYIHQALKKAQTERDASHGKYGGIVSSHSRRSGLYRKSTLLIAAFLVILMVAFAAYSWLDSRGPQVGKGASTKPAIRVPLPAHEKAEIAEAFYRLGKEHHAGGRLAKARVWYEKALRTDPGSVFALNNLGVLLIHGQNYPAAQSRFEKAILLKPEYVDPYYNLACLFALTGRPEQGLRYLKKAILMHPPVKGWAIKDADLDNFRDLPGFKKLLADSR